MHANLTQLRNNLYQCIDQLISTGEPIHIQRKGVKIKILLEEPAKTNTKKFLKHSNVYVGAPEDLVHMDWSSEWSEHAVS
jgi:hypothetical protein